MWHLEASASGESIEATEYGPTSLVTHFVWVAPELRNFTLDFVPFVGCVHAPPRYIQHDPCVESG
jgi:hypothetical protein